MASPTKIATIAKPSNAAFRMRNLSKDQVGRTSMIGCGAIVEWTMVFHVEDPLESHDNSKVTG